MRVSTRRQCYICLPCQVKTGRLYAIAGSIRSANSGTRVRFSSHFNRRVEPKSGQRKQHHPINSSSKFGGVPFRHLETTGRQNTASLGPARQSHTGSRTRTHNGTVDQHSHARDDPLNVGLWQPIVHNAADFELSPAQQQELDAVHTLRQRLSRGLSNISEIKKDPSVADGIRIDDIVKALPRDAFSPEQQKIIARLRTDFTGQSFGKVRQDLDLAATHRTPGRSKVTNPRAKGVLMRLGIVQDVPDQSAGDAPLDQHNQNSKSQAAVEPDTGKTKRRQSLAGLVADRQPASKKPPPKSSRSDTTPSAFPLRNNSRSTAVKTVEARDLVLSSLDIDGKVTLPRLSFDLSRVLFNPGVYQLRDPRSRVYNFDPYLERPMPISEFNFEALNPYMTSSEDHTLIRLAQEHQKRYIGSSSSTTSILSHFHFLLSQWRDLNVATVSRGFAQLSQQFTVITRAPAAVFLRYRDGVYAVDADKEYDEPNVLMSLGHAMEKLLTLEKDDFEKWRRSNAVSAGQSPQPEPEAFHYSEQGRFLLRSQLDVHDPRLPGTGYFDLKTRAVAGIRMNIQEHETGMGYQIKERFGTWESYEREYYDMMRSTFLKYSLQVRMGQMDGIFVAYHNITRVFGFQYIPVSEMDLALHGQLDPCLGDQEFRFSINFLEEIFNRGTEAFPGRSLRIHFETREASVTEPKPYMNIFIEPMTEEDIKTIQNSQKAQFESFERKLLRGEDPEPLVDIEGEMRNEGADEASAEIDVTSGSDLEANLEATPTVTGTTASAAADEADEAALPANTVVTRPTGPASSAANTAFLDSILNTRAAQVQPTSEKREILGLKLTVHHKINGRPVARVEGITPAARWEIDYKLETRSDDAALKLYRQCRNRRMSALKTVMNRGSDDYFIRSIREMSEKGAEWRRQQDELDAQREPVVLYGDRS